MSAASEQPVASTSSDEPPSAKEQALQAYRKVSNELVLARTQLT